MGSRLRLRRTLLGLSQQALGASLGITFQQVQKYELGANRIGASRLFDLSIALEVPVSFFFEEYDQAPPTAGIEAQDVTSESLREVDSLVRRETLELVGAYYRIESPNLRKQLFELVKSLS